jgi:hypothetical protein
MMISGCSLLPVGTGGAHGMRAADDLGRELSTVARAQKCFARGGAACGRSLDVHVKVERTPALWPDEIA